jgi:heme oxygenase (mycobilin-producing)
MKGRVVFLITLKPDVTEEQFLEAYEVVRYEVAQGVKGHIVDQVCQSAEDPKSWLITSEWEDIEDFYEWERTPEHRDQAKPMRDCMDKADSYKFVVKEETGKGAREEAAPSGT